MRNPKQAARLVKFHNGGWISDGHWLVIAEHYGLMPGMVKAVEEREPYPHVPAVLKKAEDSPWLKALRGRTVRADATTDTGVQLTAFVADGVEHWFPTMDGWLWSPKRVDETRLVLIPRLYEFDQRQAQLLVYSGGLLVGLMMSCCPPKGI